MTGTKSKLVNDELNEMEQYGTKEIVGWYYKSAFKSLSIAK
jgi:hypothetical protein